MSFYFDGSEDKEEIGAIIFKAHAPFDTLQFNLPTLSSLSISVRLKPTLSTKDQQLLPVDAVTHFAKAVWNCPRGLRSSDRGESRPARAGGGRKYGADSQLAHYELTYMCHHSRPVRPQFVTKYRGGWE